MSAEKRSLRRISNKYGTEMRAEILLDDSVVLADVVDYNSFGVSLQIREGERVNISKISGVQIYYGSEQICKVNRPRTISYIENENRVILSLNSQKVDHEVNRSERASLNFSMQGSVFGRDPFTLDQMLSFRLMDISSDGFSLISSKSNRHLMTGLFLHNYKIMLPGYDMINVSFQIKNIVDTGAHLKLGCKFLKIDKVFAREIERILLTNKNFFVSNSVVNQDLKSRIKKVKKFSSWIRIRRVTSSEEFEQVLKIRFRAYQEANKTKPGQTWKDMEDEYDKHSITYAAFAGLTIAGTIRLVVREPNSKLPFEEYLDAAALERFDITSSAEVTRFAIDPHYQGTDLFFALFRKIIFEIGAKKIKSPVCLATKKLAKYYIGIGAIPISEPVPHPTIEGESLTLYLFDPNSIVGAKMSALGWLFVARPAVRLLRKFKFVQSPSLGISKYFLAVPEFLKILVSRIFSRKK